MANQGTSKAMTDQVRESYAEDAKARRVLSVDSAGSIIGSTVGTAEFVKITDGTNGPANVDADSNNMVVMQNAEWRIHQGDHYIISDHDDDIDVSVVKYWHVVAPSSGTEVHFKFFVHTESPALMELFEDGTTSANGTALTAYNNDRNSSNTASMLAYRDPTVTGDGNRIFVAHIGTGKDSGGSVEAAQEMHLKYDAKYLIKITTEANDNTGTLDLLWYEVS